MCSFNALVLPILSYGCEVWFWHHDASSTITKVLEGVHLQFLRGLLGVKRTTHHLIALAEFGRYRLAVHWQKQVTGSGCASAMSLALHLTTHCSGRCLTARPTWKT